MSEVVVIGYRLPQAARVEFMSKSGNPVVAGQPSAGDNLGTPAQATDAVAVNAEALNPANEAKVRQAAERLAEALIQAKTLLGGVDPDTIISLPALRITVAARELLSDINNTRFIVTDRTEFNNPGVGAASRGNPNVDYINFNSITGPGGYGDSAYKDNAGLIGLIFHEMAHISAAGTNFWKNSLAYQRRDPVTKKYGFYDSQYGRNLEAFANDLMNATAAAVKFNLQGMLPMGYKNALTPTDIYNSHVPPAQQE